MTQLEALMLIAKRNDGMLTPAAVIDSARSPKSVLHGAFTWDDTEAAAKWRVLEAQRLIRRFRIEFEVDAGGRVSHPVFINLSCDRHDAAERNVYRLTGEVAKDGDLMACAVKDALDELKAVEARHRHLAQLQKVWDAIDAECAKK